MQTETAAAPEGKLGLSERAAIRDAFGNMCRCNGYHAIIGAVEALSFKTPKTSMGGRS